MHRKRYFPADLELFPLHYAALRNDCRKIDELLSSGHNCFQPIQDGETALHVAIAEGSADAAHLLFEEFRRHFQIVSKFIESYVPEDFWIKNCVLIAKEENQIGKVKQLETKCVPIRNQGDHILILAYHPIGEKQLSFIDPSKADRMELFHLVQSLIPNGVISWNSTGPTGMCESLLMLAAYYGNHEIMEQLVEQGASLAVTGPGKRTVFHAACEASQQKVIELLLTEYFDRFDPTALDDNAQHGLHYILYRKNRDSFALAVDKMVQFRVQKFGETPSTAFNEIFKLENEEWPSCGIWNFIDFEFWNTSVVAVLERYQYNLRYQWREVTALIDMITYKKAIIFYEKAIRKDHDLLTIQTPGEFTVLHALICANAIKLVDELYKRLTNIKAIFENSSAFTTLQSIMQQEYIDMMELVLNNHSLFFKERLDNVDQSIIQEYHTLNHEKVFPIMLKYLPELKSSILCRQLKLNEFCFKATQEFQDIYDQLLQNFPATYDIIMKSGRSLDSFNTSLGNSFLKQAVFENQLQLVRQLLDAKVNIDILDNDDRHVIHHVQSLAMLHLLIERHPKGPALVHLKDRNGFTVLHVLCPNNIDHKQELIVELLRLGAKLDERTNDQSTVLFYTYDEELFTFLTDGIRNEGFTPVDLEWRDFEGNTALHRQLRHTNSHISSIMLRSSKSFVNFNEKGDSYLCYLVRFDRDIFDSVLKPILEMSPDKTREMFENEIDHSRDRASKLFVEACSRMNVYCVEWFLEVDIDFDIIDDTGRVALLELFDGYELPCLELVYKLLEKDVNINVQNEKGQNVMMMFIGKFNNKVDTVIKYQFVHRLIETGLNLNHADENGDTIMHYAFRNSDVKLVSILLEHNANYLKKNNVMKMPFEVATPYISQIFSFLQ